MDVNEVVTEVVGQDVPQWIKEMIQRDIEAKQKIVDTIKWVKIRQITIICLGFIIIAILSWGSIILYETNQHQDLVLKGFIEILHSINDTINILK